jgi:hypothetical protein
MEWALVTHIRGRWRAVVSEGQELRGRQAPRKNGAFSATFCRSLERCAAPMFVMTWVGGVITPTLSIGPKSVGGLNHNPVGAFRCQCNEERAMDDPFKQTRDPRMRAERYQGLAWGLAAFRERMARTCPSSRRDRRFAICKEEMTPFGGPMPAPREARPPRKAHIAVPAGLCAPAGMRCALLQSSSLAIVPHTTRNNDFQPCQGWLKNCCSV